MRSNFSLLTVLALATPTAFGFTSCTGLEGVEVHHLCWRLSAEGQACEDLCGGEVDVHATVSGAANSDVVHALNEKYGLKASYEDGLDQPCHTSWLDKTIHGEEDATIYSYIVSGAHDTTLRIWSLEDGELLNTLGGDDGTTRGS